MDALSAFDRYEAIRHRLPAAAFPTHSRQMAHLDEAADHFDGLVLDAFGVLNVGQTAIPGAIARMTALRARGKALCVLTNAASYTKAGVLAKYRRLGFDFSAEEVVTSRDVAVRRLERIAPNAVWAALADHDDDFHDLRVTVIDAISRPDAMDAADAFLFLSTQRYTAALHDRVLSSLARNPRPVVVANPDLTAPFEGGLSEEPGLFAHDMIDQLGSEVHWFGKPFADAYGDVLARMGLPAHRLAMVGDTLHTDVLGGRAAGMGTVLITGHGLFRGHDVAPLIASSGIRPDIIAPTT